MLQLAYSGFASLGFPFSFPSSLCYTAINTALGNKTKFWLSESIQSVMMFEAALEKTALFTDTFNLQQSLLVTDILWKIILK